MKNNKKIILKNIYLKDNASKLTPSILGAKTHFHSNKSFYRSTLSPTQIEHIKQLFNKKDYIECEKLCRTFMRSNNHPKDIYLILGLSLINQNKYLEAIKNYENAIEIYNKDENLLIHLGNALKLEGKYFKALKIFEKAIKINDESISALINISNICNLVSQFEKAEIYALKVISLQPKSDKGYCNLGNAYLGMKKIEEALSIYENGLIHNKYSSELNHNKAFTLMLLKKHDKAIKVFENGTKNKILSSSSLIDYGLCLFESGDLTKSLEIYEEALINYPNNSKLLNNIGNLYSHMGNHGKAIFYFNKAQNLNNKSKEIHYNIALNYFNQSAYDQAISFCNSAIEIDNNFFSAYNLLALCYENKNNIAKCLENFHKAIQLDKTSYLGWFNYGLFCLNNGKMTEALHSLTTSKDLGNPNSELPLLINTSKFNNLKSTDTYLYDIFKRFKKGTISSKQISSYLLTSLYSDALSSEKIFELHQLFDQKQTKFKIPKNKNSKIRIGYVSGDLNFHSVGYFFEPLIENHNLKKFEIFIYYNNNKYDEKTKIIQSYCNNWRNVFEYDDQYLFNLIKNDKIDILVDLSGHTSKSRLEIFRMKPAFKQITWLGYPGTTGLKTIDYKFTDLFTDPLGKSDKYHTEKLYRIENSFICYKNTSNINIANIKPFENNKYITFGSFNNISKITKTNLETWITILHKIPNSQLVLKSHHYNSEKWVNEFITFFENNGILSGRVRLLPYIKSKHGHLAMYNMIDISLDTFPFNGATTTMESLWMGVPVITLTGERHASRVGTSILKNLKLSSLISGNVNEYIDLAVDISKNKNLLKYYQNNLRDILQNSVLCDGKGFARKIENAFEIIFAER